jgi:inhibitor of cysteine peptidase
MIARHQLVVGETWVVRLPSNPSTGYHWTLLPIDPPIVQQLGPAQFQPPAPQVPRRVGAGGEELFHLQANLPGEVTLHWVYRRPWETQGEPADRRSMWVRVAP